MVEVRTAKQELKKRLKEGGIQEAALEAGLLLELTTGRAVYEQGGLPLTDPQWTKALALAEKRCEGYPIQYLFGRWPFMNIELFVGPGALIPRQDTESVCEKAVELGKKMDPAPAHILDLCSGTGAIALAMKEAFPAAKVLAVEVSDEAMPYLIKNGKGKIGIVQSDIFTFHTALPAGVFQLILANPPYLTQEEMGHLQREVACEPALALDGGEDGLQFYRHIAAAYRQALCPGGALVFEIGAQQRQQVEEICRLAGYRSTGWSTDLSGLDRCVWAIA